jgi:large subunit ribosomal protein L3
MNVKAILGKKIGTTEMVRENGDLDCVTAVLAGPCVVTQVKTSDADGYEAVQIGFEEVKRATRPLAGHQKRAGKTFRYLREVRSARGTGLDLSDVEVGAEVDVSVFETGDRVDATGTSKGRGFAGGVKRHGFHGGPKTHGQSDRHRAPGSIGAGSTPGKVLKGQKMAGHMGAAQITVQNLEVVSTDVERNLIFVKGALPGARNSLVYIRSSIKGANASGTGSK